MFGPKIDAQNLRSIKSNMSWKKEFVLLGSCILFFGCTSELASKYEDRYNKSALLEEIQVELADVKHALHSYEVDLRIMEEKLQKQTTALHSLESQKSAPKAANSSVDVLEKRISAIEKMQEKIASDLRALNTNANQMSASLEQYKQEIAKHSQRLDEVAKLKSTLTSISKAIKPASQESASSLYKVKAGDTLEKIARRIQCTAEEIRHLNQLQNDKIVVGQDLKIPNMNNAQN